MIFFRYRNHIGLLGFTPVGPVDYLPHAKFLVVWFRRVDDVERPGYLLFGRSHLKP